MSKLQFDIDLEELVERKPWWRRRLLIAPLWSWLLGIGAGLAATYVLLSRDEEEAAEAADLDRQVVEIPLRQAGEARRSPAPTATSTVGLAPLTAISGLNALTEANEDVPPYRSDGYPAYAEAAEGSPARDNIGTATFGALTRLANVEINASESELPLDRSQSRVGDALMGEGDPSQDSHEPVLIGSTADPASEDRLPAATNIWSAFIGLITATTDLARTVSSQAATKADMSIGGLDMDNLTFGSGGRMPVHRDMDIADSGMLVDEVSMSSGMLADGEVEISAAGGEVVYADSKEDAANGTMADSGLDMSGSSMMADADDDASKDIDADGGGPLPDDFMDISMAGSAADLLDADRGYTHADLAADSSIATPASNDPGFGLAAGDGDTSKDIDAPTSPTATGNDVRGNLPAATNVWLLFVSTVTAQRPSAGGSLPAMRQALPAASNTWGEFVTLITRSQPRRSPTPGGDAAQADSLRAAASLSDKNPESGTEVTLTVRLTDGGQPVAGAQMVATWNYRTSHPTCEDTTNEDGVATCLRRIGGATDGYTVTIDIVLTTSDNRTATTQVSFNPRLLRIED